MMNIHYAKVLEDLEDKRGTLHVEIGRLRKEIEDIDRLLAAIKKVAPVELDRQQSLDLVEHIEPILPDLKGMSMRWGILCLLSDYFDSPLTWGEIADYLQKAGLPDPTGKLRKNVSAVLSRMVGMDEVTNAGNKYAATSFGRDMWASIKKSPKYLNRDVADIAEEEEDDLPK